MNGLAAARRSKGRDSALSLSRGFLAAGRYNAGLVGVAPQERRTTMTAATRRRSIAVRIGSVRVGGDAPIVVQSMTNTDTADVSSTVQQVKALARAGSEL